MAAEFLLQRFQESPASVAMVWREQSYSYQWLIDRIAYWEKQFEKNNVSQGAIVALEADFSPDAVAALIALIKISCIVVPITTIPEERRLEMRCSAEVEFLLKISGDSDFALSSLNRSAHHAFYTQLKELGHPGLVLFSSGSSGKSKAAVHDFSKLLEKFRPRRHSLKTIAFLLFDHIGGIDTLFYSLANLSCLVTVEDRSPDAVCRLVENYKVEVLPVSPTFLNMLLLRESYKKYDVSSLKYITYGAEVMPKITLERCVELFPQVSLLQKYGTTEVGTLRSKSRSSDSLWMKIGGEGYKTRIVDGILQIKADSAMLGYLHSPSPFTEDGWFVTGDAVEIDGDFIRLLGRESDIINVGGDKVYPAEVENVIKQLDEIAEVTVYAESNPIMGNIVCARLAPVDLADRQTLARQVKKHCKQFLEPYKIPVRITLVEAEQQVTARFKKNRK